LEALARSGAARFIVEVKFEVNGWTDIVNAAYDPSLLLFEFVLRLGLLAFAQRAGSYR
jgi:hypothetical protein